MKSLDEIDRKILRVLQRDASLGVDALADLVNLSRNACWRRMKNLESSGVIARRVAILDPQTVGLGTTVFVIVRTNQHDEKWLKLFDSYGNRQQNFDGCSGVIVLTHYDLV